MREMFLERFAQNLLAILFPQRCILCGVKVPDVQADSFCEQCMGEIQYLRPPICRICGLELYGGEGEEPLCGECLRTPPPFSVARSVVRYEPKVQELVYKLKYGTDHSVRSGIQTIIDRYDLSGFSGCQYIAPVPLYPKRLRQRGGNQALFLARLFFADKQERLKTDLLKRTKHTIPQTKLSGKERRKNLRGAFALGKRYQVKGLSICLVDDVFTTGTTVKECCKVLMKSGAREVRVLTLARAAPPQRGRR